MGCRRDSSGPRHNNGRSRIEGVEQDLERWLLVQVYAGVPELMLVGFLQDYADVIEHCGAIPRSWDESSRHTQPGGRPVNERS